MKTKQVGEFEVREPKVGQVFPIMSLMNTQPEQFQVKLVGLCVFKNGQPIGEEGVNDLGIQDYMSLMKTVLEVAGFSAAS